MERLTEIGSGDPDRLTWAFLVPDVYAVCVLTEAEEHTMMAWWVKFPSILVVHKDCPSTEDLKIRVIMSAIPQ